MRGMRPSMIRRMNCTEPRLSLLSTGPKTPEGVYARNVEGRVLYVNATEQVRDVAIEGSRVGVLSGKRWANTLRLQGFGVDLLEKP